ncbi:hypothetical protein [Herbaspirillum frisingense]|uniref:Uncharacterized protein n=1 Tax=Herbaspirillum frisingense TaxID=92645 RepID=A0ABU1P932_9BURK|nr:hypothetical protein [Herbaspirillum frisingense]MDR6582002.1 hypothetical protein [Herbaspirillum frisingense]
MRRLLLLLLTLLIPLQLLAATGESQLREQLRTGLHNASHSDAGAASCPQAGPDLRGWHALTTLAGVTDVADVAGATASEPGAPVDDDDDRPSLQGELEDPGLPARIATPELRWYPFPHAFSAIPAWSSYLRDQLRPPPLVA